MRQTQHSDIRDALQGGLFDGQPAGSLKHVAAGASSLADLMRGPQKRRALEFVPAPARQRLRDAHPFPLVGVRKGDGFWSFRVPAALGWSGRHEYLQVGDAGSCIVAIVLDCDEGGRLWEQIADGEVPPPNWIVWRTTAQGTRRGHAVWTLKAPVHKGPNAKRRPLRTLARVAEWLRAATRADCSYSGLLTRCPFHEREDLRTEWGRKDPYPLLELLDWVPKGWRRPRVPTTSYGRNCSLFDALRKWAYQPRHWGKDFEGIHAVAKQMNAQFNAPLPLAEVKDVAKSVAGWVAKRRAKQEWTQETFAFVQAARGRKSGKSRRKRTAERDAAIVRALQGGASTRQVAAEHGIGQSAVVKIRQRHDR